MEEQRSQAVAGVPAPALRPAVLRYKPYHLVGPPGVHRGLPSSTLTFVISLAGPVDVRGLAVGGCGPLRAFVAGLHPRPAHIQDIDGRQQQTEMHRGQAVINPAGVWHSCDVHEPGRAPYITPGRGTEHRPRG